MKNHEDLITGITISFKELEESGFDRKVFTYFVEAIFQNKKHNIIASIEFETSVVFKSGAT